MSYRSDYDAAVARVDALELENARLAAEINKARATAPPEVTATKKQSSRRPSGVIVTIGTTGLIASVVAGYVFGLAPGHRMKDSVATERELPDLHACAHTLDGPSPHDPSDLGGLSISNEALERTTGCRDEIQDVLDHGVISGLERSTLQRWLAAEDELANEVSLITTYRTNDPYALDHYQSAPQLWREYDRAYEQRQLALKEWRLATQ